MFSCRDVTPGTQSWWIFMRDPGMPGGTVHPALFIRHTSEVYRPGRHIRPGLALFIRVLFISGTVHPTYLGRYIVPTDIQDPVWYCSSRYCSSGYCSHGTVHPTYLGGISSRPTYKTRTDTVHPALFIPTLFTRDTRHCSSGHYSSDIPGSYCYFDRIIKPAPRSPRPSLPGPGTPTARTWHP